MNGYTKLHGSILDSSVWREAKEIRLVWVTLMAMADRYGVVNSSVPGLADRARVSLDECLEALERFKSPDKWSRSKEFEGRRIEETDGGWILLNYGKYRALMSVEDIKEKARIRQAEFRERKKKNGLGLSEAQMVERLKKLEGRELTAEELDAELREIHVDEVPEVVVAGSYTPSQQRRIDRVKAKIAREEAMEEAVKKAMDPNYVPKPDSEKVKLPDGVTIREYIKSKVDSDPLTIADKSAVSAKERA